MSWFTETGLFILAAIGNMILSGIATIIYQSQSEKMKQTMMLLIQTAISAITFLIITFAFYDFHDMFKIGTYALLAFIFAAILGIVIGNFLYLTAMRLVGVSKAYPVSMSFLLMTYIMEIIFGWTEFNWLMLLGITLVITGVILISTSKVNNTDQELETNKVNESELSEINDDISVEQPVVPQTESSLFLNLKKRANLVGITFALIAAFTWASGTSLIKYGLNQTPDVDVIPINGARMIFLVPVTLSVYLLTFRKTPKKKANWKSYLLIVVAALIGLVGANILYLIALDKLGTSTPAAIAAAGPIIVTPLSIIFLKEKVDWKILLGTVFTIGGLLVISFII